MSTSSAAPGLPTKLGHVALRVRDLDRAVAFYRDVVGLPLRSQQGDRVAFLGIRPDASHEVALFAIGADAPGPEASRVGMYHMAWEMPTWEDLVAFHARLVSSGAEITGYSDRQCNVMFLDPDGNENEAIWEPDEMPSVLPRLK